MRSSSFQLVTGRTWRGTAFGGVKGRTELPGLVQGMSVSIFVFPDYLWNKIIRLSQRGA